MKYLVGKIFLSHSALDKPFVRRLALRIRGQGFQTWLDEKDLVPGDALAAGISRAVDGARIVLVVVSKHSVHSKWLKYELNLATDRMVKGHCRVIPIVIDSSPVPPEVAGLLYVDWKRSPRSAWKSLVTALQYETNRAAFERGFWAEAPALLRSAFGSTASVSMLGEFRSRDYETVPLSIQDIDGNDIDVPYEVVSSYSEPARPLTEQWWREYIEHTSDLSESIFLAVTERPVSFDVEPFEGSRRVSVRIDRQGEPGGLVYRYDVVADLAGLKDRQSKSAVLALAREALLKCANDQASNWRARRARASAR